MSVAYVCDSDASRRGPSEGPCTRVMKVAAGLIGILPAGWIEVEVAEGANVANVEKRRYHLCPSCAAGFRGNLPKVFP